PKATECSMQITAIITIILVALVESWFQPWIAVAGVAAPITFAGLVLLQAKINPQLFPWYGLAAGFTLDLTSFNYFGVNAFYYLLVSWLMSWELARANLRKKLWIRV